MQYEIVQTEFHECYIVRYPNEYEADYLRIDGTWHKAMSSNIILGTTDGGTYFRDRNEAQIVFNQFCGEVCPDKKFDYVALHYEDLEHQSAQHCVLLSNPNNELRKVVGPFRNMELADAYINSLPVANRQFARSFQIEHPVCRPFTTSQGTSFSAQQMHRLYLAYQRGDSILNLIMKMQIKLSVHFREELDEISARLRGE